MVQRARQLSAQVCLRKRSASSLPIRPKPVRIRRPDDPLTPEEMNLRERLQAQVLQRSEDE